LRVERILAVIDRDDALGVFNAGRNQRSVDVENVDGFAKAYYEVRK